MKSSLYRPRDSGLLRGLAGVGLGLVLVGSAAAGVPEAASTLASAKQDRILGKKAVMHVYSYSPKTLEITSVISRFFSDPNACEDALGGALRSAMSRVENGDLVDAQCIVMHAREALTQPEGAHMPAEVTEL